MIKFFILNSKNDIPHTKYEFVKYYTNRPAKRRGNFKKISMRRRSLLFTTKDTKGHEGLKNILKLYQFSESLFSLWFKLQN